MSERGIRLGLAILAGSAILRTACGSEQAPSNTPSPIKEPPTSTRSFSPEPPTKTLIDDRTTPLEKRGKQLVDVTLFEKGDRTLSSMEIWFDPAYAPGAAGGSLAMDLCFKGEGLYRIISKEENPRPGYLVDVEYAHGTECVTKHPVIELAEDDKEVIYVGVGNTSEQTYQDMRTYKVERDEKGLNGTYNGKNNIDPTEIKLRDP